MNTDSPSVVSCDVSSPDKLYRRVVSGKLPVFCGEYNANIYYAFPFPVTFPGNDSISGSKIEEFKFKD